MSALLAARTIAEASEDATRTFVEQARHRGHTWQEIGELLTITRQAAQQRFGERTGDEADSRYESSEVANDAPQILSAIARCRSSMESFFTPPWMKLPDSAQLGTVRSVGRPRRPAPKSTWTRT